MNQTTFRFGLLSAALALGACGGKKPAGGTLGNSGDRVMAGAGTTSLATGSYACEFATTDGPMGPHSCEIEGDHIAKMSGMEPFSGTMKLDGATIHLDVEIGCTDLSVKCHVPFTVDLQDAGGGIWRGPVHGESGWWLDGATFEIGPDGSLGGEGYGGGGYGAE